MIHHVWGLFTHPDEEWQEIRGEEESISHMYLTHVLLLAAIPAVCAYLGTTKVGWTIGNGAPVMLTESSALQLSIMSYLAMLAGIAAICYTVYLLYVGIPTFMNIPTEEGFLFSSSVLAVGLVVLVSMIALSVIFWGFGVCPVYTS